MIDDHKHGYFLALYAMGLISVMVMMTALKNSLFSPHRSNYCFSRRVSFLFCFSPLLFKTHNDPSSKNNVSRCGCKLRLNPNAVFRLRNALSVPEHFRGTRGQRTHTHSPQMTSLGCTVLIRSAECRKHVFLASSSSSLITLIPKGASFLHGRPEQHTAALCLPRSQGRRTTTLLSLLSKEVEVCAVCGSVFLMLISDRVDFKKFLKLTDSLQSTDSSSL